MQSGGGVPGHGRNPTATGRSPSTSSASPASSSSTSIHQHQQQQHQQQQQLGFRQLQSLQQQQFRKPDGEEGSMAFQSSGSQGGIVRGGFPSTMSGFPRKFGDMSQPQDGARVPGENQGKGQGLDQHAQNPVHQAYLQYAFQASQQKSFGNTPTQHGRMVPVAPPGREQDNRAGVLKMQELMSMQAASQSQTALAKKPVEQVHAGHDQKPPQPAVGQLASGNMTRLAQSQHPLQANMGSLANNQFAVAQLQAMQAWAMEHNIDLSVPANANLIAQILPAWQAKMAAMTGMQKSNEKIMSSSQANTQLSKQQSISSPVGSESSVHGSSRVDASGQAGPSNPRQSHPSGAIQNMGVSNTVNANNMQLHLVSSSGKDNQNDKVVRQPVAAENGLPAMHPPQDVSSMGQGNANFNPKPPVTDPKSLQMQYMRQMQQLNMPAPQSGVSTSSEGMANQVPPQGGPSQVTNQRIGFTKQQLHVLKAQILAFRRLKRGEGALPEELLQAIAPPPLDLQLHPVLPSSQIPNKDMNIGRAAEEHAGSSAVKHDVQPGSLHRGQQSMLKGEQPPSTDDKSATMSRPPPEAASVPKEPPRQESIRKEPIRQEPIRQEPAGKMEHNITGPVKSEQEAEQPNQRLADNDESGNDKGKVLASPDTESDAGPAKKPSQTCGPPAKESAIRKYHGPLFDFPCFTRKHDSFGSATNSSSNLALTYDMKDLLLAEGKEVLGKKRKENLRKIQGLLAAKLDRKRIRPDLVLRLQIEEKKLRLLDLQAHLRAELDVQQKEIMAMPDRPYRKFVRQCERQRAELQRQVQLSQKANREKLLKSVFLWRKKLLETHWAIRDARTARNRGVAKYHEKMLREFSKRKDDDRNKRMEALKNNDVDRYREMLLEQQTNIPGDASQRYSVLSSFLSQTEDYLHKLGGKITAAKNHQEVEEASRAAAAAARAQGLSEEEVRAAAACAGEEVLIRNRFSEMNAPSENLSVNKYYNLAHAVNERVVRQPSMLRAGTLRDYQLVGLQWMLSLYNNKLNGILADEMGLGKTVQVMALLAYLMEFKGNYGPHLIIVPNAVLVNWKSELYTWLPSASCIFYVGSKEQRARLFSTEVCALKFNVLVTTYEFVMYDRSKLSKVDWKYIIIDEAQRMKDRESVLARDLDRYRCQRRLLLTGTPLQNDLKELWSLLNLLLPEVFDNRKAFHDWFSKPFQKDGSSHSPEEDDWLETEKKVIIIHRLHQILEPFMLRRRVEDVEGSLPPKVAIVLRCRMSAMQGAIYDWIKGTGTIRVDPEDELRRAKKNPLYQMKMYKNLNNKCMELRKACNHPLLNYPYFSDYSKDFMVRSCGKLWILDRILIKLQRTGHHVLLFSTMTKLLDILEEYLQWRRLIYRRIDGTTSLEDRESAIVDFNDPDTDCFIFLLSIRAAGRGLNLQTADTVVIYDPDPNPQNEEQAVARAHRIGQQREVKVIYMEAVVDKISSHQKEDELRNGGSVDSDDDLAGKDRYIGSIESLIRNNIQQYKIDMADEVINAGRFDQRTTHEERRMTLETLLHDEERYQETVHDVPSLQEVNRMIARSEEEVALFDQMDEEFDWTGEMIKYNQIPKWLRAGSREVDAIVASLSKKPSKNILPRPPEFDPNGEIPTPGTTERRRGRPRGSTDKRYSIYRELDDEDLEDSDASSEERNGYEEEGEIGEDEDEEFNGIRGLLPNNKDQSEEEGPTCDGDVYDFTHATEGTRSDRRYEDARSSGSSSGSRRLPQASSTSRKFGSLSALDAKPGSVSTRMHDELEEGEIAVSGDSHVELQQSGSWTHERDDGEDDQVLQRKTKGKRSMRPRSRYTTDKVEEKSSNERVFPQRGFQHLLVDRFNSGSEEHGERVSVRQETSNTSLKQKRNLPPRKGVGNQNLHVATKSNKTNYFSGSADENVEHSRESWNGKAIGSSGTNIPLPRMSEIMQRKCKNVVSKLQRRVEKEGHQIIPILFNFWKSTSVSVSSNLLDLRRIDQRVDAFEYCGVPDFISDLQLMLRNSVQYCSSSFEVRSEARKLYDLFLDIMKIAFPDMDFREFRDIVAFLGPGGPGAVSSPRPSTMNQGKHQRPANAMEQSQAYAKNTQRSVVQADESIRNHEQPQKFHKDPHPPTAIHSQPDSSQFPTHPADLVITKRKRNDRDKSAAMQRMSPVSSPNPGRAGPASPFSSGRPGPVSPPSLGRGGPFSPLNPSRAGPTSPTTHSRSPRVPVQRDSHQSYLSVGGAPQRLKQHPPPADAVGVEAQWAKPVKRMRTDTGKRRPSHF